MAMVKPEGPAATTVDEIASQLELYLSQPVEVGGPREPRSPEFGIIDAVRRMERPGDAITTLSRAVDQLAVSLQSRIGEGDHSPSLVALMARLGFLATDLKLGYDGSIFFLVGLDLVQASSFGREIDAQDVFQILRAAGRSDIPSIPADLKRLFWWTLLRSSHGGIRTLAAQNVVRLDPTRALMELPSILQFDVNEPLLAHEFLQAMGEEAFLRVASIAVDALLMPRLAAALVESGYPRTADGLIISKPQHPQERSAGWRVDALIDVAGQHFAEDMLLVAAVSESIDTAVLLGPGRSRTVHRFMTLGGVAVSQDYLASMAASRDQLSPPSLVGAS